VIGKAIGAIIVIILFLGILYSVGKNQQITQQQPTQQQPTQEQPTQQQSSQEEDNQEKSEKKSQKKNEEKNQEKNNEENTQEQSGQQQGGQEEASQQQGGQEHTESDTGSQTAGTIMLESSDDSGLASDGPKIRAFGKVMNNGDMDARNVIVEITFHRDGLQFKKVLSLGDIAAGGQSSYDETFFISFPSFDSYEKVIKHD
jgi:hypothetical protein